MKADGKIMPGGTKEVTLRLKLKAEPFNRKGSQRAVPAKHFQWLKRLSVERGGDQALHMEFSLLLSSGEGSSASG